MRVQSRSQSGPKSLPKWSKIELKTVLQPEKKKWLGHPRGTHLWKRFWKRFGGGLGDVLDPKSISEAILKALPRGSLVPIPKIIFFNQNPRFLRPPGRSKSRKIRHEDDSISEPSKPSKSLIFLRKITIFTTSRDVTDLRKESSSPL